MTDALNQRYKKRVEVRGEEGTLVWNWKAHEIFFAPRDESERVAIPYKHCDHLFMEMEYVVETVRNGKKFEVNTIGEAVRDLELVKELME